MSQENGYKPYSLLTGKLKNWFRGKTQPESKLPADGSKSNNNNSNSNQNTSIKPFQFPEPKVVSQHASNQSFRLPGSFSFDEVKKHTVPAVPTPAKHVPSSSQHEIDITINETMADDHTANEILSNFFKTKGDKPLSDIEYQGVMALISKSRTGSPVRKRIISESVLDQNPKKKFKNNEGHDIYKQRALINDTSNISINTSEYKPNYYSIHNDTFDRSNQSFNNNNTTSIIPSIKRVYQFSGLPSPYSTRIRAPSSSRRPSTIRKAANKSSASTTINNDTTADNTFLNSKSNEFKSETSKLLLSVLDGKAENDENVNVSEEKPSKPGFKFVNPYSRNGRKVSRSRPATPFTTTTTTTTENPKRSISITANDIEKTISYDKSVPLPPTKSVEKVDTKPSFPNNKNIEPETASTLPTPSVSNGSLKRVEPEPESKTTAFSFAKQPVAPLPKVNGTTDKPKENVDINYKKYTSEFTFPDVAIKKVDLNLSKLEEYKSLFPF
ncbi:NUP60 Nucleoporin NUP60 [Candida maltosa Xu316]